MILPTNEPEDGLEYEESVSYHSRMHKALAPLVKKFLVDSVGERFYSFESEVFREIEEIIKVGFMHGDMIPTDLRAHCTITDEDLWQKAYHHYNRKDAKYNWQKRKYWYEGIFENDDDNEFLAEIPESEWTDDQNKANNNISDLDQMVNYQYARGSFLKKGCDLLIPAMQKFVEKTFSFDLTYLSPAGYEQLQNSLDDIADYLFDYLYPVLHE